MTNRCKERIFAKIDSMYGESLEPEEKQQIKPTRRYASTKTSRLPV